MASAAVSAGEPTPPAIATAVSTVLVVDDHPVVRAGMRCALTAQPWVAVVHEASCTADALRLVVTEHIDVAAVDLRLGDEDGVECVRKLRVARPGLPVLVVTMMADEALVARALDAGAAGYLLKSGRIEELVEALDLVQRGGTVLGPGVEATRSVAGRSAGRSPSPLDHLTRREREIARLLSRGAGSAEIARALGVKQKTIQNQMPSLLLKLGVPDRVAAVLLLRDAELGS